jgi:hypothetical protein
MVDKKDILKNGYVIVKVTVSGVRQTHRLNVVREKESRGEFYYLTGRYPIPENEMVRLAEELQMPIKSKNTMVFPKGKMKKDFIEVKFEPGDIEAEIE